MKLQSFNLTEDYNPGKANLIADMLSRPPCDGEEKETCGVCTVHVELPQCNPTMLRNAQLADPETCKILKKLEGQEEEMAIKRWTDRGYYISQGVLYRYAGQNEEPQLVIPKCLKEEIMVENHNADTVGYGGIEKTLNRISKRYYFPGMRRYVEPSLVHRVSAVQAV